MTHFGVANLVVVMGTEKPISSTRILPSLARLESGPIRTLRCEMATHLVSDTARTLAQIAIRIVVHTHVPNVDL